MKTCTYAGAPFTEPRAQPWTDALGNAAHRYYDLRATPSLIRTSMEDFLPWSRYAAIEQFYDLLEWLNAPASPFESNDCAFVAPHANEEASVPLPLACSGRVMLFLRDLPLNLDVAGVARLEADLHRALAAIEPQEVSGIVGTTRVPVRYLTLPEERQLGQQLMISFWAFGHFRADVMENLEQVIRGLSVALRGLVAHE